MEILDWLLLLLIALLVVLALRSIVRTRKSGGCIGCSGCSWNRGKKDKSSGCACEVCREEMPGDVENEGKRTK